LKAQAEYTHDWVKVELADPKFRSKVVRLKTDYKREQKSILKQKFEQSEEYQSKEEA
jgi:hypothetical protein